MAHIDTLCVQAGYAPEPGQPRITPIAQSTTYMYDDADHVAGLFDLEREGHMYTRISNPTVAVLEEKVAALEGGVGAVATASGQSANTYAILALAGAGDHVISTSNLYGGTHTLLSTTLARLGIETTFIPADADAAALAEAVRPETKLVFGETIGNPGLDVLDIAALADAAHSHDLPLVLDNTLATPALCRPLEHGADVVTHSTTKYLDGHATSLGGVVVDSGRFPWSTKRHGALTNPDPAYHGLSWTEQFGPAALLAKLRAGLLRDLGAAPAPFNAFLTTVGIETLGLRMARHSENALAVATWLQGHEKVAWVSYPGLPESPSHALASRYLPDGASGVLTFGVTGGVDEGKRFINATKLASLVVHVGDLRTHVLHPASMTHRQLSEADQRAAGVTPDMVRLSVGIEHADDIIADLDQALAHV